MTISKFDLLLELETSLFDLCLDTPTCWVRLYMQVKFEDNWSKTTICITKNVTISFKHEKRRPNMTSRCDVISDIINIKGIFSVIISDDFSISDVKMNLSKIFHNFQNGSHFEVRRVFEPKVAPEIEYNLSLHVELAINALAWISTELWQFQNLTYFFYLVT